MATIEEYAVKLIADGGDHCATDDLNEDGDLNDDDWESACNLALAIVAEIRANPNAVLALVGRSVPDGTTIPA